MRYEAPSSFEDAAALLGNAPGAARVLAGGTDLVVQMRSGRIEAELLVDVKRIEAARAITQENGGWRVGAAVSGAELGEHDGVRGLWPGVVEAVNLIGSTQVQGRATLVGNLCNGSPAADSTPALIAAGAALTVVGPAGSREVAAEDFIKGPGETTLAKGELVASTFLPARPARSGDAYLRFIPRTEMDIAAAGAAVSLTLDESGAVSAARVAIGAVGPKAILVPDAAAAMIGSRLEDAALDKLAAACSAAASPIDDKRGTREFRLKVVGVLAKRAALIAQERAKA